MANETQKKQAENPKTPKELKKGFLQATHYLDSHLNEGEVPVYRAHLSWKPSVWRIFIAVVVGIILAVVYNAVISAFNISMGNTAPVITAIIIAIFLVLGILWQIPSAYRCISTDILITNYGIHSKERLIAVENDQFTRHAYINDAELDFKTILGRIFKVGNIEVSTVAGCDDDYMFVGLANPMEFKNALRAAQQNASAGVPFVPGQPVAAQVAQQVAAQPIPQQPQQ